MYHIRDCVTCYAILEFHTHDAALTSITSYTHCIYMHGTTEMTAIFKIASMIL